MTHSSQPLAGVTVIDMTRLLPGGFATLLLAGLGADVIKVEEPIGGDGIRAMMAFPGQSESAGHLVLNRGKRSIALDLKQVPAQEILRDVLASSDVLIDSFRPGVLDRLGLSAVELKAANPKLVHISITAFGDDAEFVALPAHDLNAVGYAGLLGLVASEAGAQMPGLQNADLAAGMHAALATLAGLRLVATTGLGYRADVGMAEAAATLTPLQVATSIGTGQEPPLPDLLTGALACYRTYRCADGQSVTVGGLEAKFFARMVDLMGAPELAARQYDIQSQASLHSELEAIFASRSSAHWLKLLAHEDTCVGPVNGVTQALTSPLFRRRGAVTTAKFQDGTEADVFRAVPWDHSGDAGETAPTLGQDTAAVLEQVGVTPEQLMSLVDAGIVRPAS